MQHQMKLTTKQYNKIVSKKKVIESRLYDEKRQQISLGDKIIFNENGQPDNTITAVVRGLLRYQTFKELFSDHEPSLFGEESVDFLINEIRQFYSEEEEQRFGVVGIRLEILD
jgi:ASC-1-like (ASCH) protein